MSGAAAAAAASQPPRGASVSRLRWTGAARAGWRTSTAYAAIPSTASCGRGSRTSPASCATSPATSASAAADS